MIWLTGSALGICLLMIFGLLGVILVNGLGIFWPKAVEKVTIKDGTVWAGELAQRQAIPNPGEPDHLEKYRLQLKVGNRDLYGFDFNWVNESEIASRERPPGVFLVERSEYGPLIGTPIAITEGEREVASDDASARSGLGPLIAKAASDREGIETIEKDEIGSINYELERLRLRTRKLDYLERETASEDFTEERAHIQREEEALRTQYAELEEKLTSVMESAAATRVRFRTVDGQEKELRALDIYRAYPANELSIFQRAGIYLGRLWGFLTDEPREANTEGGIWPAIFGTVMMVFLMSLAVVPLGVLAALYLREYAKQGVLVRTVRVAVNNLAGVPSIVFGVFGLGFFVYFVGGGIDRIFFPEALPTPTYGTGGILWASLTLALLTVPVVIVASEEALAAVPRYDARGLARHGRDEVSDHLPCGSAGGGARDPDRAHSGNGTGRGRSSAPHADRSGEARPGAAARRFVSVFSPRPQVHASWISHLRRRFSEPERRGREAHGIHYDDFSAHYRGAAEPHRNPGSQLSSRKVQDRGILRGVRDADDG